MTTDLSESDQKALESEFDDLLGDFSGSNGPQQNGEVITTVTKTSTDGDKVTTVTTKEVVSSKSYDAPQVETELLHVDTAPSGGGSQDHSSLSPLDDAHSNNIMSHSVTLSMSPPPELLASTTDPFSEGAGDFPDHMGVAPQAEEEGLDDEEMNDVSMEDEEAEMERDGDEVEEEEEEEEEENSEESVQHIPLKEPQTESVPHEDTMDSLVNAGEEVQKEETPADGEDAKEYQDEDDDDDEGEKEAAEDYAQTPTMPNQTEELDQEKTTVEETEELDTDDTEQQHRNLNLNPEGFDNKGLDQDDGEEKACVREEEDLPPNTSQQILEDSQQHDGKEAGDDAVFDGGSPKEDKTAVNFVKERYEAGGSTKDLSKAKVQREPKKLDHHYEKRVEELNQPDAKDLPKKGLPTEQDLVKHTTVGVDYTKQQYQSKVERSTSLTSPTSPNGPGFPGKKTVPPVVNRQQVEKVAPPAITRNVRAMFESGEVAERHKVKKSLPLEFKKPAESGTFENEPVQLEGVVREGDMEEETLESGKTKNLLTHWKTMGQNEAPKQRAPIKLAEDEGHVLESQPTVRSDVIRESDSDVTVGLPERGKAKNLLNRWSSINEADGTPKKRAPVKLVEGDATAPVVFENQPTVREDVIRSYEMQDDVQVEMGNAKNLKGYWATRTDDVEVKKEAVKIDRDSKPIVLESQPVKLEGVVRETDVVPDEMNLSLEAGHAKTVATRFLKKEEGPKERKQPIQLDKDSGPAVVENQPAVREDVVRHDENTDDVVLDQSGRTKDIASKYLNKGDEWANRKREKIVIDRSSGPTVIENQPAELQGDVVRAGEYTSDLDDLDSGRTKNMVQQWIHKEEDSATPKTSTHGVEGKPRWVQEIEAAKDSGVFENEPEERPDVSREQDINEEPDLIPDQYARTMRHMWDKREEVIEAEKEEARRRQTELVRFTPPRERTPPPLKQQQEQEYQSYQRILLSGGGTEYSETNGPAEPAQNGTTEEEFPAPPSPIASNDDTVKSSAVLTLRSS